MLSWSVDSISLQRCIWHSHIVLIKYLICFEKQVANNNNSWVAMMFLAFSDYVPSLDLKPSVRNSICLALEEFSDQLLGVHVLATYVTCSNIFEMSQSLCHLHIYPSQDSLWIFPRASFLTRFIFMIWRSLLGQDGAADTWYVVSDKSFL